MSSTHHSIPILSQLSHHPTKPSPSQQTQSPPFRLTNRKNHLRSKILKTLKPYQNPSPLPPHEPPQNLIVSADPLTPFVEMDVPMMSDSRIGGGDHGFDEMGEMGMSGSRMGGGGGDRGFEVILHTQEPFVESDVPISSDWRMIGGDHGFEEVEGVELGKEMAVGVSLVEGTNGGLLGRLSGAGGVVKCGFYVVWFFVAQFLVAVWLMSVIERYEQGFEKKRGGLEAWLDESGFFKELRVEEEILSVEKMAEKIGEIRRMAREVRAKEGRIIDVVSEDLSDSDHGNDGDCGARDGSRIRDLMLNDVGPELSRSRNKLLLNGMRSRSSDADARTKLGEMGKMNASDLKKQANMFIFKKQYMTKNFKDSDNGSVKRGRNDSSGAGSGDVEVRNFNPERKLDGKDNNDEGSGKNSTLLESSKGLGAHIVENKHTDQDLDAGSFDPELKADKQNSSYQGSGENSTPVRSPKGFGTRMGMQKKQKAQELKNTKTEGFENKKQELQDSRKSPKGFGVSQKDEESNPSQPRSKSSIGGAEEKSSTAKHDLWWLNLPHVTAILLQNQGLSDQGPGLYCLKGMPKSPDEKHTEYIIAFEDHLDAKNFCNILETDFSDIEDTSVDLIPLPVKDLSEAVKSGSKNVFVVKKQQLHLYAGQPLAEVEARLYELLTPTM